LLARTLPCLARPEPPQEHKTTLTHAREQYRLSGHMEVVGALHPNPALCTARRSTWAGLSDAARAQFAGPAPGLPRAPDLCSGGGGVSDAAGAVKESGAGSGAQSTSPPPVRVTVSKGDPLQPFCLLVLHPREVRALQWALWDSN
jgi:hypothetical protein